MCSFFLSCTEGSMNLPPTFYWAISSFHSLLIWFFVPLILTTDLSGSNDGSVQMWEWGHTHKLYAHRFPGQYPKVTQMYFNDQGNKVHVHQETTQKPFSPCIFYPPWHTATGEAQGVFDITVTPADLHNASLFPGVPVARSKTIPRCYGFHLLRSRAGSCQGIC